MEIYAGFLEQTDHEIGRVTDAIEDLWVLDDTLIYYIIGDNGASAEGTPERLLQRDDHPNGMAGIETTEFLLSKVDDFGTPRGRNQLPRAYPCVNRQPMSQQFQCCPCAGRPNGFGDITGCLSAAKAWA
jgi:hypothetical protein